ncbi:unnamed protein product [Oikopleura dioica]|uniref:BZIP domain-containing protein n=1 Tax=Oikopleura dioica TaxID=34765 RepID=E4X2D8_OIKDI|nr:unnamed protein product [Oikopleura dioica]
MNEYERKASVLPKTVECSEGLNGAPELKLITSGTRTGSSLNFYLQIDDFGEHIIFGMIKCTTRLMNAIFHDKLLVEDGCSSKCNVGPSIAEFMNAFRTSKSKSLCEFENSKMEEFEKGILAYFDVVYGKFLLYREISNHDKLLVEDGCSSKCNVGPSIAEFMNAFRTSKSKSLCEFENSKMEEFEKGILAYFDVVYGKFLLYRQRRKITTARKSGLRVTSVLLFILYDFFQNFIPFFMIFSRIQLINKCSKNRLPLCFPGQDSAKDSKYWTRRVKNNAAARRSREGPGKNKIPKIFFIEINFYSVIFKALQAGGSVLCWGQSRSRRLTAGHGHSFKGITDNRVQATFTGHTALVK